MPDNQLYDIGGEVTFAPMFQIGTVTGVLTDGWQVQTPGNTEVVKIRERLAGGSLSANDLVLLCRTWNHRWIILGKIESRT